MSVGSLLPFVVPLVLLSGSVYSVVPDPPASAICLVQRGAASAAFDSAGAGGTASYLTLHEGAVLAWPGGRVVWRAGTMSATALSCEEGRAVVGAVSTADGKRGRVFLLSRGVEGWREEGEIDVPGVPDRVLLSRGRLAIGFASRSAYTLRMMDARPGAKYANVPLQERPSSVVLSPDGDTFLVAAGKAIRSFRVEDGSTWMMYPFSEPIGAVATKPDVIRILAVQGRSVVAVDPRDRAPRGILPLRAKVDLDSPASALAWTGDGRVAVALVRDPPELVFLNGEDLSVLERRRLEGALALTEVAAGKIAYFSPADGGKVIEVSLPPEKLAVAVPPSRALVADAAGEAARAASDPTAATAGHPSTDTAPPGNAVRPPAAESSPLARSSPPGPPAGAPKAAPPATPPEHPTEAPGQASPPAEAHPEPEPQAQSDAPAPAPAPAPIATTPPVTAEVAPAGTRSAGEPDPDQPSGTGSESAPTSIVPHLPPATTPESAGPAGAPPQPAATAGATPQSAASAGATPQPAAAAGVPAGGTISGRLTGQIGLAAVVVVLGPDSLTKEYARIEPIVQGSSAVFTARGLPPGRYRLIPMGKGGASLLSAPPFAAVSVSLAEGARADFAIHAGH